MIYWRVGSDIFYRHSASANFYSELLLGICDRHTRGLTVQVYYRHTCLPPTCLYLLWINHFLQFERRDSRYTNPVETSVPCLNVGGVIHLVITVSFSNHLKSDVLWAHLRIYTKIRILCKPFIINFIYFFKSCVIKKTLFSFELGHGICKASSTQGVRSIIGGQIFATLGVRARPTCLCWALCYIVTI